jgi:uncharacterized coiled-coil protein SlyX
MTNTFKVGDLVTWTEEEIASLESFMKNSRPGFAALFPPLGFYRVIDIDFGDITIKSLEDDFYEQTVWKDNVEKKLRFVTDKFQDDAELISALDSIGQI